MKYHKYSGFFVIVFFLFTSLTNYLFGEGKFLEITPWDKIDSVSVQADVHGQFTEDFLKLNNKPEFLKANKRTEHVTMESEPDRYLLSYTTDYADGSKQGIVKMTYDGEYTSILTGSVDRTLSITKRKFTDLSTSFFGYDALFFPYNFLFEADNAKSFKWGDLGAISDLKLWQSVVFTQKPTEYTDQNYGNLISCQIERPNYTDKISLSPQYQNLPIYYTRIDKDGKKIMAYFATKIAKIQNKNSTLYYASEATIVFYLGDFEIIKYNQIINKLSINKVLAEDAFQMDPSMAKFVWDADAQKIIKVPQ
jgi:hypothetical protein